MTLGHSVRLLVVLVLLAIVPSVARPAAAARPNIVFILADDLDLATMSELPGLQKTMASRGTSFTNHFVSVSLCCPSRATILRGQYAHNSGVFGNKPPSGGYEVFHDNGSEASTLAVWLKDAGYRTGLMGKYLNGYPGRQGEDFIPPGWTEWYVPARGNAYRQYDYALNENGRIVPYGDDDGDYLTTVLDAKATEFIRRGADDDKPFFLFVSTYAPHAPATPPPKYEDALPGARVPRTASFNEDVSDKPRWLSGFEKLGDRQIDRVDALYRKRVLTMYAVQELVDHVVDTLEKTGQLGNTYIVFMSDNGFHLGQHRLAPGNNTAFDTDIHVPFYLRGPDIAAGRKIDALTANVDFAPTFAAMAGVPVPDLVDGRSLLPLLAGEQGAWRQAVLLEHGGPDGIDLQGHEDGTGLFEPPDFGGGDAPSGRKGGHNGTNTVPAFTGVRTARHTYVRYTDGERELYDNAKDPSQLENIASVADPALLESLERWTHRLGTCRGATCRSLEEAAPAGPDR